MGCGLPNQLREKGCNPRGGGCPRRARRSAENCRNAGAPVAKALLGKAVLPDDSVYTTGGIGHLGTQPSQWIMQNCDTLRILGSTMPWIDSYPKQGSARCSNRYQGRSYWASLSARTGLGKALV